MSSPALPPLVTAAELHGMTRRLRDRARLPLALSLMTLAGTWATAQTAAPAAAPVSLAISAAPTQAPRAARQPLGCMISPKRVADIGASVVGVARAVHVDVGDTVKAGQTLVALSADVESASVRAAEARSDVEADINAAQANLELARQRHARAQELRTQGFVSSQASDQSAAELKVAHERWLQARAQQTVSQRDAGVARAQLGQRTLRAPFSGVVVDRYVNDGERVEDRPVLRIAQLDPLRVEAIMPASRWGSVKKDDLLAVQPDLPGVAAVTARVVHVDRLIDPASNTFRVRMDLPNKDQALPGGARCKLELPEAAHELARPASPAPMQQVRPAKTLTPTSLAPLLRPSKIIG